MIKWRSIYLAVKLSDLLIYFFLFLYLTGLLPKLIGEVGLAGTVIFKILGCDKVLWSWYPKGADRRKS